ncbi:hypothetical protein D3C78_1740460 [compost metagenome]
MLVGADDVGEVAAKVVVAQLKVGRRAFDEAGFFGQQWRGQAQRQAAAEGAADCMGFAQCRSVHAVDLWNEDKAPPVRRGRGLSAGGI